MGRVIQGVGFGKQKMLRVSFWFEKVLDIEMNDVKKYCYKDPSQCPTLQVK